MGIHIWKRFGPRSAFQYLNLSGVYSVGTKAKKKQQVFLKGGNGYIYKQDPGEEKIEQSATQQCGAFRCLEEVLW